MWLRERYLTSPSLASSSGTGEITPSSPGLREHCMRSVPSAFKPKSHPGVVASHGSSGRLVAAQRTTPGAESALFKGRSQMGSPSLLVCPQMRGSKRSQEEGTRRPLARALQPCVFEVEQTFHMRRPILCLHKNQCCCFLRRKLQQQHQQPDVINFPTVASRCCVSWCPAQSQALDCEGVWLPPTEPCL